MKQGIMTHSGNFYLHISGKCSTFVAFNPCIGMPYAVSLPISKSIANRLLILQARAGIPLLSIGDETPDDVRILHDALTQLTEETTTAAPTVIDVNNCGTAMRFLAAYCALANTPALLTGCLRMQ